MTIFCIFSRACADGLSRSLSVWTCLLCLVPGTILGDAELGASTSIEGEPHQEFSINAVSFNVRYQGSADKGSRNWVARLPVALEVIHKMKPDVMGVQEALSGQLSDLKKGMPSYNVFGVGRDDGKRKGEHVSVFYRKERFRVDQQESGHFWLSATPDKVASTSWGNGITRMCTWLRLVDKKSGRGFYVFNTHWDHRDQKSREYAARLIAQRIDQRKHLADPVVLMGDFNVVETNVAMAYLTGKKVRLAGATQDEKWNAPMIDVFQSLHPEQQNRKTFNGWSGQKRGMAKIDHVLVSAGAQLHQAEIHYHHRGEIYPSDHYPVSVKISYP